MVCRTQMYISRGDEKWDPKYPAKNELEELGQLQCTFHEVWFDTKHAHLSSKGA